MRKRRSVCQCLLLLVLLLSVAFADDLAAATAETTTVEETVDDSTTATTEDPPISTDDTPKAEGETKHEPVAAFGLGADVPTGATQASTSGEETQMVGTDNAVPGDATAEVPNSSVEEQGAPDAKQDNATDSGDNSGSTETSTTREAGTETSDAGAASNDDVKKEATAKQDEQATASATETLLHAGPFVDLFGPGLLSLEYQDSKYARTKLHGTNDALAGKKVVGVYFSADWCGPCRQFTPELVTFYNRMNARRGRQNQFEIVWISRCRDVNSFGQYFTQMGKWYALPPEEAMGQRGQALGDKFKVKGIPTLVLLDEEGSVITLDGRNMIPKDKAGIGFPWRNPIATLYLAVVPRSVRSLVKSQIQDIKGVIWSKLKLILGLQRLKRPSRPGA